MKPNIRRWLGLAIVPAAVLTFLAASPAYAADYTGDCANVPASVSGHILISQSSACTISHNISATGNISISTSSGNISAQNISSGYNMKLSASSGSITTKELNSNLSNGSGNILITASGNVRTDSINTNGGTTYGAVEINANTDGTTSPFVIGGTGQSNGVNGSINTSTTTGGGSDIGFIRGGVFITNGDETSTGGITVTAMNNLQVTASASRSGFIILNAQNGTLTLPTGTMSADGPNGHGAGSIYLFANTVTTADGTVLSATQTSGATGTYRDVMINANTVNITGSSGLEMHADGNGADGVSGSAQASILPKGSITITSNGNYQNLGWSGDWSGYFQTDGAVNINGTNAPLKVTANGDYTKVGISGNGITFNNGDVTLEAKGSVYHEILIAYFGGTSDTDLTFSGTGDVVLDASADSSGLIGGDVNVYTHKFTMNKDSIAFKADGSSGGASNGGKIYVSTSWDAGAGFQLDSNATATFSANASSGGTGDAQYSDPDVGGPKAITLWAGGVTLKLGTDPGQVSFSANGGSNGGDAGAVVTTASNIQLMTANAVDVSAIAGDGNGGSFQTYAYINSVDGGISNPVILAKGHGDGIGGRVKTFHNLSNWDVLTYIKVDAGNSMQTAEDDYGRLTLNAIDCQQRYVGSSWPKTYWNCVTTGTSSSLDKAPRDVATSSVFDNLRTLLGTTNKTEIFVFAGSSGYSSFHYDFGVSAVNGGISFKSGEHIYVNPWQSGGIGDPNTVVNPYSINQLKEVAAHELGHAVDLAFAAGGTLPSNGSNWGSNNLRDTTFDLDQVLDPTITQMVHRFPCKPTPFSGGGQSTNVPFAGVTHLPTGNPVCLPNGDVNDAILQSGSWNQSTVTGTQVLSHIENIMATSKPEMHAQIFAYKAVGNLGARPMLDKVMDNNFFPCLKAWAATELSGSLPSSGSCSEPLTP